MTITAGQTSSTGTVTITAEGQRHRRPRQGVDGIGRGDVGADGTGGAGVADTDDHGRRNGDLVGVRAHDPGPSPRARGSPHANARVLPLAGSIPASAGKPCHRSSLSPAPEVHPRERGEARSSSSAFKTSSGPSPRARGSLVDYVGHQPKVGSIPASAGKPLAGSRHHHHHGRVHPRERGRSHVSNQSSPMSSRSIPASAGKPTPGRCCRGRASVHPRERGEARCRQTAGYGTTVHPRERGEAVPETDELRFPRSPSPRARGSRHAAGC